MSDLISRSELLKAFNNKNVQITFDLPVEEVLGEDVDLDDFAMLVQDAIQAYKKMAIDTIINQPTAYDIDKVVEELKCDRCESCSLLEVCAGSKWCGECHNKIVEIVKHGVISDDVCEWKYNDTEYYWESSCDHLHIFMSDGPKENEYDFCPYCGKKIKAGGAYDD